MEDVAQFANRVWVMHEGKIAIDGTPEEVYGRVRRNAYRNPADYAFDIFADTGRSAFAEAGNQCSGC